ncbi:hypothetical protein GQ457_01G017790 [Hibiscus cannabinus]
MDDKDWEELQHRATETIRLCLADEEGHDLAQHVNVFNQIITDLIQLDVKIEDEDRAMLTTNGKQNAGESSHVDSLYVKGYQDRGRKLENEDSGRRNSRSKSRGRKMIRCYKCKEVGHMKRDCPKLKNQTKEKDDATTKTVNVVQNDNTDCSDGDMLSISTTHCCNIVDIGEVRIKMYDGTVRTLCDVRYIPDLKKNLISLGTLHKNGFIPKADEDMETIRIVKGALIVMKGKIIAGNIYKLLGSTVVGGANSVESCDDDTKLWHMCLGHLSESEMVALHKRNLLHGVKSCNLEFYDFSKKVWVYFLKQKSEVFAKFKQWKPEVENQTGRKIKYLRSPRASLGGKVVEEVWSSNVVDFSNLRIFGCPTYVHVPGDERSKLDAKSKKCIFLGYKKGVKGYKFWDLIARRMVINRDAIFDEHTMLQ